MHPASMAKQTAGWHPALSWHKKLLLTLHGCWGQLRGAGVGRRWALSAEQHVSDMLPCSIAFNCNGSCSGAPAHSCTCGWRWCSQPHQPQLSASAGPYMASHCHPGGNTITQQTQVAQTSQGEGSSHACYSVHGSLVAPLWLATQEHMPPKMYDNLYLCTPSTSE
jgi:hypothetical protein